jgi:zinc protease
MTHHHLKARLRETLTILLCVLVLFGAQGAKATEIQEVVAPRTGVKAWLVEEHKLPIVSMRFAFDGGCEQDPLEKQGLASLTMGALTQGAGPYNAAAFQHKLAEYSITLSLSAERDQLSGALKFLKADKDIAFSLLHLALTQPRFDPQTVERLRGKQLSSVRRQFSDPGWQARYALLSQLYANHPYSQRCLGTTLTLPSLSRADLRDFVEAHIALNTLTVAVAGDITPDELSLALDKVFADLPERARLKQISDVGDPANNPSILVRRDGTQTDIVFGMAGPKRDDPDYYAAQVSNYILGGGGFSSRLMQEVRDKKGLTYGVSTGLASSRHAGLIIGHAAVDNVKFPEAMSVIREAMRRFQEDGPTAKEIDSAKDYLTGAMPLALTSTNKIAEMLVEMQREKLGRDYLDRYAELIRGVSRRDIQGVLDRYFNPDKMTVVMVGKPEGVTPTFTKDTVNQ